ncbi:MAG: cupin domain-containing protein [Acidobacteriota bacterium]|nr:cupin domain-containing protein [Acidobacteriota bacterium]
MKAGLMNYAFVANLPDEITVPEQGILSRVIHKDENTTITAFGFSAGEELSPHSASTPAILYFLEGEAEVQLGDEMKHAQPGTFIYMPPMLVHGISTKSSVKMLLIQIKR